MIPAGCKGLGLKQRHSNQLLLKLRIYLLLSRKLGDASHQEETPADNDWVAGNQFTIKSARHTRRPDIILFVNGLPLVLLELKNPVDENADIWKAFDQIQTYKEQIPDVFQCNEILVISDGTEALLGSLSADAERFMAWRTIDGKTNSTCNLIGSRNKPLHQCIKDKRGNWNQKEKRCNNHGSCN